MLLQSKKTCVAVSMAAFMASAHAAHANTLDDNKVVIDTGGNIVRTIQHGTCVRTQWEAGSDICAPIPPAKPMRVTRAPRTLETAQKAVYFEFDSARLTPQAEQQLTYMARELQGASDVRRAHIVGYADHIGTGTYNQELSKRRAETVENYLNQRGYLQTRVTDVQGVGERNPVTSCDPDLPRSSLIACLGNDRRVEVAVQYLDEPATAWSR